VRHCDICRTFFIADNKPGGLWNGLSGGQQPGGVFAVLWQEGGCPVRFIGQHHHRHLSQPTAGVFLFARDYVSMERSRAMLSQTSSPAAPVSIRRL